MYLVSSGFLFAQPEIEFVNARYKTTSGAIGPHGVVATHSFDIHLKAENTLILEGIIISGYYIYGRNMLLPPILDGLLKLKLVVTIHQKDTVWYNAQLTHNEITVPLDVIKKDKYLDSDLAVMLKIKSKGEEHWVLKNEFDSNSNSYNK